MVLHNHQPIGQADHVFEEIFEKSYERQVAALERHPGVRLGLHYTGSLLDWLRRHRPEFIQRVRALVQRGQVEVLSGGYYEPVLPSIPDDDKVAQILKLNQAVRDDFGYNPTGMWLAERVWEPTLPTYLSRGNIEWTLVDDVHFKMVGLTDADVSGYFVTENNGDVVNVFGTAKTLRYNVPWRPVEETINFLRDEAQATPGKILVIGDDGEKFGAWPDTLEHCWGTNGQNGWVDDFFSALEENAAWLHCITLGDHVRHFPAVGRVYLPTASYNEMMEWALPAGQSHELNRLTHEIEAAKVEPPYARFIRGGFWRNYLVKYDEINTQHKKMLRVHDKIQQGRWLANERGDDLEQYGDFGQEDLWRGQSNDTYWHGLFGGIYMTDIRARIYGHLIRAQQAAELGIYGDQDWLSHEITDFDRDSLQELLVEGNALDLYFDLADGGSIFEWDLRKHFYNLASTLTRRQEAYHATLKEYEEKRRFTPPGKSDSKKAPKVDASEGKGDEEGPESPHDAVRVREANLDRYLTYDSYRRGCMIDHFLGPGTTLESFMSARYNEEGDFVNGAYHAEIQEGGLNILHVMLERDGHIETETGPRPVRVSKRLSLRPGSSDFRVLYTVQNTGDGELSGVFGSEWNLNLLGGGRNPSAYYKVEGAELEDASLESIGEVRNVRQLAVGNSWLGIEMTLRTNVEATFWRFPIYTVSGSEAGFERTYQGNCVLLHWLFKLPPGESVDIELEWLYTGSGVNNPDFLSE
jgi:alpha-amylase